MEIKRAEHRFELKEASDDGAFTGYAAVYGNVDNGLDIIEAGAFDEMKLTKSGELRIAVHHDMRRFIGSAKPSSDAKGLHVSGKVDMSIPYARDAFSLMRSGVYDAMSVGYQVKKARWEERDGYDIRVIESAILFEASVLPFGMNDEARIIDVKSDKRLFESTLRERMGLSQKEAKHLTSLYFANREDSDKDTETVTELKNAEAFLDNFLKGI